MKRIVLMVMLLVAGGLALAYLAFWAKAFLPFAMLLDALWGDSAGQWRNRFGLRRLLRGFRRIGADVVHVVPAVEVYASLAAGGDRVMARHGRIHGVVAIAGLLPIAVVIALVTVSLMFGPDGMPTPGSGLWTGFWTGMLLWVVLAVMMVLPPAGFCLAAIQLFSVVVAFRILVRGGQQQAS